MKKVIFSIFFFSLMVVGVQAQKSTCSKSSCTAKPAAAMSSSCGDHNSASAASATEYNAAAAKLASMDPTIETRTCPGGSVSYVRKETGAKVGEYTYVDLAYDATTNSFVNVSPVKMEGASGCGAKSTSASGAGCCAGKATTTSSSANKSCCAGKGKTTSATPNKN